MDLLPVTDTNTAGALPPRLSREQAILRLRGRGALARLRRGLTGELRSVALLYVPYRIYEVVAVRGRAQETTRYAADAVSGALDPYVADSFSQPESAAHDAPRNVMPATLDPEQGAALLHDHVRRMIYRRGFFRAGNLDLRVRPTDDTVLVPYWVGFFGHGEQAQLRVVDGLRGTIEGAKARETILHWLNS